MGHLTKITGLKKEEIRTFVLTPFWNDDLRAEARDIWEGQAGIFRTKLTELEEDITEPEKTVLYVLAHSGKGVSVIAGDKDERMDAKKLVTTLVDNGLPPKILAIKIWACFSGVNGFAEEVKAHFRALGKGYDPVVVGYNEATGGPFDIPDSGHKHVFEVTPEGTRGKVIGRASAHRTIY